MIPWLKNFFTDETAFAGLIRSVLLGLGTAVSTDMIPVPESYDSAGIILIVAGGLVRSSSFKKS